MYNLLSNSILSEVIGVSQGLGRRVQHDLYIGSGCKYLATSVVTKIFITMIYSCITSVIKKKKMYLKKEKNILSLTFSKDVLWKSLSYHFSFLKYIYLRFRAGFWFVSLCDPYYSLQQFWTYIRELQSGAPYHLRDSPPEAGAMPLAVPAPGPRTKCVTGRVGPQHPVPRTAALLWVSSSSEGNPQSRVDCLTCLWLDLRQPSS